MLRVWDCNSVLHSIDLCCVCCNAESYAPSPNNGTETMTPWKRVSSAKQTNPNLALYSIVCCTVLCCGPDRCSSRQAGPCSRKRSGRASPPLLHSTAQHRSTSSSCSHLSTPHTHSAA